MASSRTNLFSNEFQNIAAIAKCLSHPARLKILNLLHEKGETQFGHLIRRIPLSRYTVYHHLDALKQVGIVEVNEQPPYSYYSVNKANLQQSILAVERYLQTLH